ncbi:UbiA family prenyltransferase, partial [Vibrio parahaemolyticus]|nr:UbiA family prenyltransferase [Vibrio parahaemolyticus]
MSKEIALSLNGRKRLSSVYLKLTKPKVVALMLVTAVVGMSLAPVDDFPWLQAVVGLTGIGLMAGSAAAFNHLIDRRIDARMARTHKRPLPSGETKPSSVIAFATVLGVLGFVLLYAMVNPLTAWLTLMSLLGYAMVYTMYLKRATP